MLTPWVLFFHPINDISARWSIATETALTLSTTATKTTHTRQGNMTTKRFRGMGWYLRDEFVEAFDEKFVNQIMAEQTWSDKERR